MPDIPRRSLAAGAGLLVGAMALKASAQQQIATNWLGVRRSTGLTAVQ